MSILAIFLFSISAASGIPLTFGSTKFISGGCKICGSLLAICKAVASFATLLSSIFFIFSSSFKRRIIFVYVIIIVLIILIINRDRR
jgi:hypothetical protein